MDKPDPLGHSLRLDRGDIVVGPTGSLEAVRGVAALARTR
jgi:hypothetical protein